MCRRSCSLTWNSMEIGGRDHAFCTTMDDRSASATKFCSDIPWNRDILHILGESQWVMCDDLVSYFQIIALSAGTYFALPADDTMLVLVVLSGVGIRTTTS